MKCDVGGEAGSPGLQAVVSSEIPGRNLSWTEPKERLASPGGPRKKTLMPKNIFQLQNKKYHNLKYTFNYI